MRRTRAFTLMEALIVISILIILFAITFPLTAGAREAAKQRACTSNLRQLHFAATIYSADYLGSDQMHPDVDWPQGIVEAPLVLTEYGATGSVWFCPDTPSCVNRKQIGSTYIWNGFTRAFRAEHPDVAEELDSRMSLTKNSTPVIYCMGHDEVYYYPREQHIDPGFNPPFVIDILANGATVRKRRTEVRPFLFRKACTAR